MNITKHAAASQGDVGTMVDADKPGDTAPSTRRSRLGPLWLQVLVAVVVGVAIGVRFPDAGASLKPLGDGFVMLIRMALAPIIFMTVVVGIARMGDIREV